MYRAVFVILANLFFVASVYTLILAKKNTSISTMSWEFDE